MELFEIFSVIGTVAFALSGAYVAMEEEYDILGVLVLGLVTAFGGGIVRNIVIGVPVTMLWSQGGLLLLAIISIVIAFILPLSWIHHWKKTEAWFDAIGLAAFAIQGALYATGMKHPILAVVVAAMLTGIGGGIIRDLLAGRKPLVLREEIYAVWSIVAGLVIGLGVAKSTVSLLVLFVLVVSFRMLSVYYKWKLPRRSLKFGTVANNPPVNQDNTNDQTKAQM
ncbi:trimeric intracellular cation channel family protein [Paenibacillus motobuensis]|uniref:trimeric intracellular cation channel family protein n=1 Tax=Paenibacillus TaxID=44249 RepID=UPI00203AFAD2|nr:MULTISPECIES: trimeric intracellular cation channel family protein [Paenibacillus]MCM3039233.1 trimeric intracellular cation channel family protein [Paenibacillus lutimineralis]MCM3646337.1 trimeric intracellular cation channel family protein [Paenibacillus motobuensis]